MTVDQLVREKIITGENDIIRYSSLSEPCDGKANGDFTGVKILSDGRILFYLGDVTGHGRNAEITAKKVEKIIEYTTENKPQLRASELAEQVNEYLPLIDQVQDIRIKKISEEIRRKNRKHNIYKTPPNFVTAFFAIYDPKTQLVEYANAGHGPSPLYFPDTKNPKEVINLKADGLLLGVLEEYRYQNFTIILRKAKTGMIFMATDGVTERAKREIDNAGEENILDMFGQDRLLTTLIQNMHRTEPELITSVYNDVYEFGLPTKKFHDDISMFALTIKQ